MILSPVESHLLFSKNDPEDPRLGEAVSVPAAFEKLSDFAPAPADFHVLGYPDDEGISLGGGRVGAQNGPSHIRRALYKMTPHLKAKATPKLTDWGDLAASTVSLAERHERARNLVKTLCAKKQKFIALGGGHDYGYADSCGFLDVHGGDAVVINFDAHLDVRPSEQNLSSGTPFYRMLTEFSDRVKFFEFGLQDHCNSRSHFAWAEKRGAKLYRLADLTPDFPGAFQKALTPFLGKKVFLSLDIDSFTSMEAPGCSQSWTSGLELKQVQPALRWLYESFDVRGLGIYEVSPALDSDDRTSKLAALLVHQFIFSGKIS